MAVTTEARVAALLGSIQQEAVAGMDEAPDATDDRRRRALRRRLNAIGLLAERALLALAEADA